MLNKKWITIVIILILAAVGGTFLYLRFLAGKRLTLQTGAELVPQNAEMMAFISSDPQDWSQLKEYGTPELREILQSNWEEQKPQFFKQQKDSADSEINYEEDIAPWLGNVAIASFSNSKDEQDSSGSQDEQAKEKQNFLAIAGIKNPIQAWRFRNSLDQDQATIEKQDYQGVTIRTMETEDGERYHLARVKGYLLVSSAPTVIESTIDTVKKEKSSFASTVDIKPLNLDDPVASFYLSDEILKVPERVTDTPENVEKQIDQLPIQSMAMGVDLKPKGVHLQTSAQVKSQEEPFEFDANKSQLLGKLPKDTIMSINGKNLSAIWSQLKERSENNPSLKKGIENFQEMVPIDLDEEGFGWIDGEYAIALFPTQKSLFPEFGVGGALLIESSQPEKGKQLLTTLGDMSQGLGDVSSRETTMNNTNVTLWELQQLPQPVVSHGWLEKELLLLTIGTPFQSVTDTDQQNSLKVSDKFSAIEQLFPNQNSGYLYFDVEQAMTVLENLPQDPFQQTPREAKAIMKSLRQVGLTTSQPNPNTAQIDLFVSLESSSNQ